MGVSSGRMLLKRAATRIFLRDIGITQDPFTELEEFLLACEQANPRYKGGKDLVRFELNEDPTHWEDAQRDAIINLAGSFGMLGGKETPFNQPVKVAVATAGANRSTLQRTMHLVQSILDGRAAAELIVVAGSTRPLRPKEIPFVKDYAFYGEDAKTEWDCCIGAKEIIREAHPGLRIIAIRCDDPKSGTEGVIEAVMNDERVQKLGGRLTTAWITTQIYVEGLRQKLAISGLKYPDCTFLGFGHSSEPEVIYRRALDIYLSEGLTTIRNAAIAASMGV